MNEDSLPIDLEVDARPWPFPEPCVYCASDNEAVRDTFCNATCPGCIARHFNKPAPPPKGAWRRLLERVFGRVEEEE